MRKLAFLSLLFMLALTLSVTVWAQDATEESVDSDTAPVELVPWTCPTGFEGQTLNVYNWSTYVADDTISNFETLCGVSVTYDVYESSEALLNRLRSGNPGYDVVVPTGNTVLRMITEELLVPLDKAQIPNIANVTESLLNPEYDPDNLYTLPYQWGTVGVGYNIEAVGGEITSWEQVWNHDGPVAWLEDLRVMMGFALVNLGYDANTTNPDEIAAARDFLIERGNNVVYIAGDDGQERLAAGEVDIAVEYMGDIFQIMADCECDDFAFSLPMEGADVWVDNLAVPVGAQNPALAHVFLDYILDPQVGADISNYTAYASPNQAAIDAGLIDPEYLDSPVIYPDATTFERLFTILSDPTVEQMYNDAWDEVKILIGG
ncbi:MAG: spermidine/putrescine ABC transporter substrate-binding protein [Burkholderiales bacterium]|nr:spermidine/putrescine ABC transporter substrate-binding protein [Anaerolineae bacterium]